jgi:sugar/nucleoside kinase (ribokinase family)
VSAPAPTYDCLCAGIVVADYVCAPVPHVPAAGGLVMTDHITVAIGGCASNVATDLAKLGRRVGVVGRVGDDAPGGFVRDALSQAGVDTTHLLSTPGRQTSGTLIVNVRNEDRRFIHAYGANAAFVGTEVSAELARSARVLYLGGFFLMPQLDGAAAAAMFQTAREAGATTVLDVAIPDPAGCWEQLAVLLPWTDVFLPNVDEGRLVTELADPFEQAQKFHAAGAKTVVITCGNDGAVLVTAGKKLRSGTFPIEFVDGTGSGDAFAAGYISGLLDGRGPEECIEIGSALGASCVRRAGATTGVFTRDELAAFLQSHKLPIQRVS